MTSPPRRPLRHPGRPSSPLLPPVLAVALAQAVLGAPSAAQTAAPADLDGGRTAFVEVAAELGLDYLQSDPGTADPSSKLYLTGGMAAGDADGDGWVDLYAALYDDHDLLFHNAGDDGHGTHLGFVDVTDGSFESAPGSASSNGPLFFDLENDGDLDLYVTSVESKRYELWVNDGSGFFAEEGVARGAALVTPNDHFGTSAAAGDYDLDGYLDLYVAEWGNSLVFPGVVESHSRLLRNTGGAFEDVTNAARVSIDNLSGKGPVGIFTGVFSFSPSFSDLDDDGYPDLAIASDFGTSRLFWNRGNGAFLDGTLEAGVGSDENGMGSAIGDYDGDGDLDWFVTSIHDPDSLCQTGACNWGDSGNRLYRNEGARSFVDATDEAGVRDGGWGWGATFLDHDNDGDLDLAHTNGIDFPFTSIDAPFENDRTRFFRNDGDGTFVEVGRELGIVDTGSGKALFAFDYDRDGDLDLGIVQNGAGPLLYRNDVGSRSGWLRVELRGTSANRFGVGARVTVTPRPGAAPLVRELRCGSNYLSQGEPALLFGLGRDADRVARVEVRWPGGGTSVLEDVRRNHVLRIEEPAPRAARHVPAPRAAAPAGGAR